MSQYEANANREHRRYRVAIGGIGHETNTFSPLATELNDFEILEGAAVLRDFGLTSNPEVELVPTLWAQAFPGGLVRRQAYLHLRDRLIGSLRAAGPIDGVCLSLHGAMEAEGVAKAEADLLAAVREVVGTRVPIAVALDLHGNVTPSMAALADVFTAYRTAPHRDATSTRQRAFDALMRILREHLRPKPVLIKPPLVLPGEQAVTDVEPMRSLVQLSQEVESVPGILAACILVGCAWTDVPHNTTSVIVTAEREAGVARAQAERLAEVTWDRRRHFRHDVPTGTIDECIDVALTSSQGSFFITDSGDNPTAGAPGDVPVFLERLIARNVPDAVFASISDAAAVADCRAAGVGEQVRLSVGGKLDSITAPPFPLTGEVIFLSEPHAAGQELAVVRAGGVRVILSSERAAFTAPEHFRAARIDPLEHRIVVVKQGYLFAELRPVARHTMMALSPGLTDLVLSRLPYAHMARPAFPFDPDMTWSPRLGVR